MKAGPVGGNDYWKMMKKIDVKMSHSIEYFTDEWVKVRSLEFFGEFSKSPDGNYLVAWRTGSGYDNQGSFVLAHNDQVIHYGNIKRPMEAYISNNGISIFQDCRFTDKSGVNMKTSVIIKDRNGDNIFKKELKTLLINRVGISTSGSYAAYMTAGGKTVQANTLFFIDIAAGKVEWSLKPCYPWADFILFDESSKMVILRYREHKNLPDITFSYSGEPRYCSEERH